MDPHRLTATLVTALLSLGACERTRGATEQPAIPAVAPALPTQRAPVPAPAPPASDSVPWVHSASEAEGSLGRVVRVRGTAQDAKLSAALVSGTLTVFCLDHSRWEPGQLGSTLTVTGTLERTSELQATRSQTGIVSQGTDGPIFVIRRCQPTD